MELLAQVWRRKTCYLGGNDPVVIGLIGLTRISRPRPGVAFKVSPMQDRHERDDKPPMSNQPGKGHDDVNYCNHTASGGILWVNKVIKSCKPRTPRRAHRPTAARLVRFVTSSSGPSRCSCWRRGRRTMALNGRNRDRTTFSRPSRSCSWALGWARRLRQGDTVFKPRWGIHWTAAFAPLLVLAAFGWAQYDERVIRRHGMNWYRRSRRGKRLSNDNAS